MSIFSSIGSALGGAYNAVKNTVGSIGSSIGNFFTSSPIALTGGAINGAKGNALDFNNSANIPIQNSPSNPYNISYGSSSLPMTSMYPGGYAPAPISFPAGITFGPNQNMTAATNMTLLPTSFKSGATPGGAGGSYASWGASDYSSPSYTSNLSSTSASFNSLPSNQTISSGTLGAGTPSSIMPSAPTSTNYASSVIGGNIKVGANAATGLIEQPGVTRDVNGNIISTGTEQKSDSRKALDEMLASLKTPPSEADSYTRAIRESGLREAQIQKNNTQNAINGITTKMNTDLLGLRGTAAREGVTEAVYGGQVSEVTREATIKLLPLQAQLAVDQGNLQLAQENTNTLFKIYADDAKASVDFYNKGVEKIYTFLTDEEKKKIDEKLWQKNFNADIIKTDASKQSDLANKLAEAGNMAGYRAVTSVRPPTNVNSPTFAEDYQNYKTDLANAVTKYAGSSSPAVANPQYAGVLNTILGSGTFTKEQKATVINAINNGEDPFTVVKNQAKKILGTEGKDLTKLESAKNSMETLDTQLKAFYSSGGQSDIFKGNFEKVANNLGNVNDPKLVTLAVSIAASLQKYRNSISGTAYSEQEGKDISSIFPGITKGEVLNSTIVKARLNTLDSDIDGLYRNALGSSYDQLKKINTPLPVNPFSQAMTSIKNPQGGYNIPNN